MRTIDEIKGKCEIFLHDGQGSQKEHWVWNGSRDKRDGLCVVRAPDYESDPTGAKTKVMSVRKAIFMMKNKRAPAKGKLFFQTCTIDGCVSPHCTSITTKKRGGLHVSARMKASPRTQARLSAAALRTWDKRGRKVSDEQVAQIIANTDKGAEEVAEELGLHPRTVWEYRTGRARRQARQQALGIFSGLLR